MDSDSPPSVPPAQAQSVGDATPDAGRVRRRAIAIALGSVVALGAAEGGLRVYHASQGTYELDDEARAARESSIWMRSDDPELVYVHRPKFTWREHGTTEASGLLRPADVTPIKPAGVWRVAIVGDSVGAALQVAHAQRFPTILERVLRDVGENVEVLNFCVNGYGTLQEARLVETRLDPFDIDVLVFQYCINDPLASYTPMTWFVDPDPPTSFTWDAIRRGSETLTGTSSELAYVPKDTFASPDFWIREYDPESESWARVRRGFDRIAAWSEEHDVPVLFVVVPLFIPQDPTGRTSQNFREQAAAEARARGFECVDLQSAFAHLPVAPMQLLAGDPYHPSAKGHAVIAGALVQPVLELLERTR